MDIKKTAIIATLLATTSTAEAQLLEFDWTGAFTLLHTSGDALNNGDFSINTTNGYRTEITGTIRYDSFTGAGTATVTPFEFFGGGPLTVHDYTLQAIGDGNGGQGNLIQGDLLFDWAGNLNIGVDIVFDAGGFLTSGIFDAGNNYTGAVPVGFDVPLGAGAVSPDTEPTGGMCAYFLSGYCFVAFDDPTNPLPATYTLPSTGIAYTTAPGFTVLDGGPQLMSTIDGNPFAAETSVITQIGVDGVLGTADDVVWSGNRHTDGLSGIRMDNGPFSGFNANFDVRTMTLTSTDLLPVPVPAAIWLFGSGLLGLIGLARRKAA